MQNRHDTLQDTRMRSIIKGISYRILGSLTTMLLVYIISRRVQISLEVGGLELIAKLLLYYSHERMWNWIDWGKILSEQEGAAT